MRVEDPYHWLRDPGYPTVDDEDVLSYLRAENAYFEAAMAPHQPLIETLFQEMRGRIQEDDSSVPVRDGDGVVRAAMNVTVHAAETGLETLTGEYLPMLLHAASEVAADWSLWQARPQLGG